LIRLTAHARRSSVVCGAAIMSDVEVVIIRTSARMVLLQARPG
jgi:hypothetical protein